MQNKMWKSSIYTWSGCQVRGHIEVSSYNCLMRLMRHNYGNENLQEFQ